MPPCNLDITDVWKQWSEDVSIVTRLNKVGRLVEPHKTGSDMKTCNKDAASNAAVLRPLVRIMAEDANWELFNLGKAKKESLASTSTDKVVRSSIHSYVKRNLTWPWCPTFLSSQDSCPLWFPGDSLQERLPPLGCMLDQEFLLLRQDESPQGPSIY